jgi:hypothetical protein
MKPSRNSELDQHRISMAHAMHPEEEHPQNVACCQARKAEVAFAYCREATKNLTLRRQPNQVNVQIGQLFDSWDTISGRWWFLITDTGKFSRWHCATICEKWFSVKMQMTSCDSKQLMMNVEYDGLDANYSRACQSVALGWSKKRCANANGRSDWAPIWSICVSATWWNWHCHVSGGLSWDLHIDKCLVKRRALAFHFHSRTEMDNDRIDSNSEMIWTSSTRLYVNWKWKARTKRRKRLSSELSDYTVIFPMNQWRFEGNHSRKVMVWNSRRPGK